MEAADDERASERGSLDDDNGLAATAAEAAIAVNTSNEAVTLVRQCITDSALFFAARQVKTAEVSSLLLHRSKEVVITLMEGPERSQLSFWGGSNLLSGFTATTITAGCVNWSAASSRLAQVWRQITRPRTRGAKWSIITPIGTNY